MNTNDTLIAVRKIWTSGTTLVVSVPKEIRQIKGLKKGDRIIIEFGKVIKNNNTLENINTEDSELPDLPDYKEDLK